MEAALGIEAADGTYREIDALGYARATISPALGGLARFAPATVAWGMVRAWRLADGEWQPLAQPGLVRAGDVATLDALGAALHVMPAPVDAAQDPAEAPPLPALEGRWRR